MSHHVIVSCSSCRAGLVDVFVTRPTENQTWKVKANCPFCGDGSFAVEVNGGFHIGGMALTKADEPEEDKAVSTIIDSSDIQGDTFVFVVKKASKNARPIHSR